MGDAAARHERGEPERERRVQANPPSHADRGHGGRERRRRHVRPDRRPAAAQANRYPGERIDRRLQLPDHVRVHLGSTVGRHRCHERRMGQRRVAHHEDDEQQRPARQAPRLHGGPQLVLDHADQQAALRHDRHRNVRGERHGDVHDERLRPRGGAIEYRRAGCPGKRAARHKHALRGQERLRRMGRVYRRPDGGRHRGPREGADVRATRHVDVERHQRCDAGPPRARSARGDDLGRHRRGGSARRLVGLRPRDAGGPDQPGQLNSPRRRRTRLRGPYYDGLGEPRHRRPVYPPLGGRLGRHEVQRVAPCRRLHDRRHGGSPLRPRHHRRLRPSPDPRSAARLQHRDEYAHQTEVHKPDP